LFGGTAVNSGVTKETLMQPDITLLLQLQMIDYDIGELERSKEYLPDMMENLKREMTESKEKVDTTTSAISHLKVDQKAFELEAAAKEASLAKLQQQMMSIKTNKEYDALVAEIDTVKGAISQAETKIVELMDKISGLEKELPEHRERAAQITENNSRQLQILQEKVDSIAEKMSGKDVERKGMLGSIPNQILSVYERVRKGKGGSAVIVIKRRACGACQSSLTPKKVQEIKRADRIHTCDVCGRILYWDNEHSN
jgi:uncharacterized protein